MKTKKPLTDKVYRQVYLDIINGEILPDEFITEGQLVERFWGQQIACQRGADHALQ